MGDEETTVPPLGKEKPTCIAIVICNEVIEDKRTNNKTLVGIFNRIQTPQLPALHFRMFIMASLTNGIGNWPITFRISDPSGKEILKLTGEGNFADPLAVLDIVVEVRGMQITKEGVHFVDLCVGDGYDQMAQRRFFVERVKG